MKLVHKFVLAFAGIQLICSVDLISAAETTHEKVVRVLEVSGTLRTATTLIGGDPVPEVFLTLYRIDGQARLDETNLMKMLGRVDGTFHQKDPLPTRADVMLVAMTGDEQGIMFAIDRNGEITYRGVREFADGLFEYERREGSSGSFVDKELAATVLEQQK